MEEKKQGKKVLIATPTRSGDVSIEYVKSIFQLKNNGAKLGVTFDFFMGSGISNITAGRDEMFNLWLEKTDYDVLLFIDSDTSFFWKDAFDAINLIFIGEEDACCIAQRKKEEGVSYNLKNVQSIGDKFYTDGCGFGFFAVSRLLAQELRLRMAKNDEWLCEFDAINTKGFSYFNPLFGDKKYLSEDYSFCKRVVLAGYKIRVCSGNLGHIGIYDYRGNATQYLIDISEN